MRGRSGCVALLACLACTACGADGDGDARLDPELPLNKVLTEPGSYETVSVSGTVNPIGDSGFILSQRGVSIFVDAGSGFARGLEEGDEVRIAASVETLDSKSAASLRKSVKRETLRSDDRGSETASPSDIYPRSRTRIREGAPYLELLELESP